MCFNSRSKVYRRQLCVYYYQILVQTSISFSRQKKIGKRNVKQKTQNSDKVNFYLEKKNGEPK